MIQGLEDPRLALPMRLLSLHWHLEMMVGYSQQEPVMVEWCSMMFVASHSLLLFFVLIVVQRWFSLPIYIV